MKTRNASLAMLLFGCIMWSCSSSEDLGQKSLKTSIESNIESLNTALTKISASPGYQVLALSTTSSDGASMVKSSVSSVDSTYNSILLADIAGIYEYKATPYRRGMTSMSKFFTKTGDSDFMIVKLPESKVKNY